MYFLIGPFYNETDRILLYLFMPDPQLTEILPWIASRTQIKYLLILPIKLIAVSSIIILTRDHETPQTIQINLKG